jgi:hypothetical protein
LVKRWWTLMAERPIVSLARLALCPLRFFFMIPYVRGPAPS